MFRHTMPKKSLSEIFEWKSKNKVNEDVEQDAGNLAGKILVTINHYHFSKAQKKDAEAEQFKKEASDLIDKLQGMNTDGVAPNFGAYKGTTSLPISKDYVVKELKGKLGNP